MGISHEAVESVADEEQRKAVMIALVTLEKSGVIEQQKQQELDRLVTASDGQDDADLLSAIREYRRRRVFLDRLSELGQQYDGAET